MRKVFRVCGLDCTCDVVCTHKIPKHKSKRVYSIGFEVQNDSPDFRGKLARRTNANGV